MINTYARYTSLAALLLASFTYAADVGFFITSAGPGKGAKLQVQGPNPLLILASGTVEIFGEIDIGGTEPPKKKPRKKRQPVRRFGCGANGDPRRGDPVALGPQ